MHPWVFHTIYTYLEASNGFFFGQDHSQSNNVFFECIKIKAMYSCFFETIIYRNEIYMVSFNFCGICREHTPRGLFIFQWPHCCLLYGPGLQLQRMEKGCEKQKIRLLSHITAVAENSKPTLTKTESTTVQMVIYCFKKCDLRALWRKCISGEGLDSPPSSFHLQAQIDQVSAAVANCFLLIYFCAFNNPMMLSPSLCLQTRKRFYLLNFSTTSCNYKHRNRASTKAGNCYIFIYGINHLSSVKNRCPRWLTIVKLKTYSTAYI